MMRTIIALLALCACLLAPAYSQDSEHYIYKERASTKAVTGIADRFSRTLKQSGMTGVVEDIRRCYFSEGETLMALSPKGKHLVRLCMIYDRLAYSVDLSMRSMEQAQFQNSEPVSEYLTDDAFNQRFGAYVGDAFPEQELAVPYLSDATRRALKAFKF